MLRCMIIVLCVLVSGSAWAKKPPKKQTRAIKFRGKHRLSRPSYPLVLNVYTKQDNITKILAYNARIKVLQLHKPWSCPKTQTVTFDESIKGLRVHGKYCAPKNKTLTIIPRERTHLKYPKSWKGHIKRIKPSQRVVHLKINTFTYKTLYLTLEVE